MENPAIIKDGKTDDNGGFEVYTSNFLSRLQEAHPNIRLWGMRKRISEYLNFTHYRGLTIRRGLRSVVSIDSPHPNTSDGKRDMVTVIDPALRADVDEIVSALNSESGKHYTVKYAI